MVLLIILFGLAIWGVFGQGLKAIGNSTHLSDRAKMILIIGVSIAFMIWWMTL